MIAVAGEALIDAHRDGDLLRLFPGGGPFNTAIALGRLGAPTCYLGAISQDRLGRQLEQTLRAADVDTRRVVHVAASTPIAIVDSTSAEPSYSFYLAGIAHEALRRHDLEDPAARRRSAARRNARSHDRSSRFGDRGVRRARGTTANAPGRPEHPARADRGSRYIPAEIRAAVQRGRPRQAQRGRPRLLYPDRSQRDAVRRLLAGGAGCVVLTHGPEGAEGWTASGSARVTAPAVTVVDTVGAGDAFGAGLLAWLWRFNRLGKRNLRRLSASELEAALAYAAAVAAAQCTRASAWALQRPTSTASWTKLARPLGAHERRTSGIARVR